MKTTDGRDKDIQDKQGDENFILTRNFRRCLLLYGVHFVILSHSVVVAAWSGIQHEDPQMTLF